MLDRRFYLPYSPLTFEEKKYEEVYRTCLMHKRNYSLSIMTRLQQPQYEALHRFDSRLDSS